MAIGRCEAEPDSTIVQPVHVAASGGIVRQAFATGAAKLHENKRSITGHVPPDTTPFRTDTRRRGQRVHRCNRAEDAWSPEWLGVQCHVADRRPLLLAPHRTACVVGQLNAGQPFTELEQKIIDPDVAAVETSDESDSWNQTVRDGTAGDGAPVP